VKRWIPVIAALLLVGVGAWLVFTQTQPTAASVATQEATVDFPIVPQQRCARLPRFVKRISPTPVMIDLSQKEATGVALRYGPKFADMYHPPSWARFGHMGTYTADVYGNLYLAPMPFISVKSDTFRRQQALYRIDAKSGKLEEWMRFEDVKPDAHNPYGIVSVVYDCSDHTLWVSAVDQSTYEEAKGRIYHIDIKTRTVLKTVRGVDALTLAIGYVEGRKVLLFGNAKDPTLELYDIRNDRRMLVVRFDDPQLRVRKIRMYTPEAMKVELIAFRYSLVAASSERLQERTVVYVKFDRSERKWRTLRKKI